MMAVSFNSHIKLQSDTVGYLVLPVALFEQESSLVHFIDRVVQVGHFEVHAVRQLSELLDTTKKKGRSAGLDKGEATSGRPKKKKKKKKRRIVLES